MTLEMAREDSRIAVLPLPGNHGQGYARNVGVAIADAAYVTFLDQDDEHVPGWYNHALELLELNASLAAVKGEMELIGLPADIDVTRGDVRWRAIVSSVIWNVVMRKVIYGALGGSPTSAEYRTREGNEDRPVVVALTKNFRVATTSFVAARHYVQPTGAAAYFLRRTKVVDNQFVFVEATEVERNGTLTDAHVGYQDRAESNLESLRAMLKPRTKGLRLMLARISARMLQKM